MPEPIKPSGKGLRTSLRLSLQFAFLYSILSAVIFAGAYWFTNYEVRDWLYDQMASDVTTLSRVLNERGVEALQTSVAVMADVNFENARIFQLSGPDGTVLAGNIDRLPPDRSDGYLPVDQVSISGDYTDEISGYWITQSAIGPYLLVQGTGDHVIAEVLEALGASMIVGFVATMVVGSIVGIWVGRLTENRIQSISGTLKRVAAGELSARVTDVALAGDDLSRVSHSINVTLEQLERLVESQVQISNDIAHDLRTPLQRLRQRLEKMVSRDRADATEAQAALIQTEEIITTFNALLRIAQLQAGDRRERFRQTNLVDLVTNVHEAFEPSAEEGGQRLFLKLPAGPVMVQGDPDLLMQLISNLVENSLRHTPSGTDIMLNVMLDKGVAVLVVADTGPGIEQGDHDKVFRRFFRGEKSRTSSGNGLGLSLCLAIAELHHASIALTDNAPGLRVAVRFGSGD